MLRTIAALRTSAQAPRAGGLSLSLSQRSTFHSTRPTLATEQQKSEEKAGDRTTLDPQRSEVSKSGTDAEVAAHPAAYDPQRTSPESEMAATAEESQSAGKPSNPLDMSPANKEAAHWQSPGGADGGPTRNAEKASPSSRQGATKNRVFDKNEKRK